MAISIDAVRAHPEYQAMLANLTAVQARCTELLDEVRALRAQPADGDAPSAPTDEEMRLLKRLFTELPDTPVEPKPRAVLVSGPSRGTTRCPECAMAVPLHKVSCSHCPGNVDGPPATAPIPMLLTCPACRERHIDRGRFATKVHHTHACQGCGHVWRPAIGPTVGVQHLPGFKDEPEKANREARMLEDFVVVLRPFAEFYKGIAASRSGRGGVPVPATVTAVTVHGQTWAVESEHFRRAHRACVIYDPAFVPGDVG